MAEELTRFRDRLPTRTFLWTFSHREAGRVYYETSVDELARYRALYGVPEGVWCYAAPEGAVVFRCEHECCAAAPAPPRGQ
jgi:hypothetical protein